MMRLHEHDGEINSEIIRYARAISADGAWFPIGSVPEDVLGRAFEAQRLRVERRGGRVSPKIKGLTLIKTVILTAYRHGLIETLTAQKMIDACRAWEA